MNKSTKKDVSPIIILFFTAIIITLGYFFISFSTDISKAIVKSVNNCLILIIPSLYGFMILAQFIIKTNLYTVLSKPFSIISRYVFKIPSELFSVYLISIFAGFPIGAKLLYELLDSNKISKSTAENMLCYCYSCSPAFIVGIVGVKIFSSVNIGLIIFLSIVLANLLLGIIIGLFKKLPEKSTNEKYKININSQIFVSSIECGAKSLFQLCSIIVFFSIFVEILNQLNIVELIAQKFSSQFSLSIEASSAIVKTILEITNISDIPKNSFNLLPIITSLLSFGSICIIFQLSGILKGCLNLTKFLLARPVIALFSGVINAALINTVLVQELYLNVAISSDKINISSIKSVSPIPSVFLIIMTILLLIQINVTKSKQQSHHR